MWELESVRGFCAGVYVVSECFVREVEVFECHGG